MPSPCLGGCSVRIDRRQALPEELWTGPYPSPCLGSAQQSPGLTQPKARRAAPPATPRGHLESEIPVWIPVRGLIVFASGLETYCSRVQRAWLLHAHWSCWRLPAESVA